jgi:hypothetical protein
MLSNPPPQRPRRSLEERLRDLELKVDHLFFRIREERHINGQYDPTREWYDDPEE